MRKFTASLLIAVTLWGSLIAPARALPVLPLVAYLIELAGAHPLITSVAVHAAIASIALTSDGNGPSSSGSNTAIQVQLDPYTPLVTPDSAKPGPVAPNSSEEVVSNEQAYYRFVDAVPGYSDCIPICHQFSSRNQMGNAAAAADWGDGRTYTYNSGNTTADPTTPSGSQDIYIWLDNNVGSSRGVYGRKVWGSCPSGSNWNGSACVKVITGCPPNYTLNAPDNMCYPNNPNEQQVADAKTQIQRTLDQFAKNPNDPDALPPNVSVGPKDITIQTPERTTKVHINDDSTVDVREIVQTPDGNTQENKVKLSAPGPGAAPEVIGKSQSTYPGQSSNPPLSDGSPGGAAIPGTGSGESGTPTGTAAPVQVLKLPDGLAQSDKQCGYDDAHKCKVDQKIDETGTPDEFQTNHGDQLDAKFDEIQNFINNQQNGVGEGLQHPLDGAFSSECRNPEFNAASVKPGAVATIDICSHAAEAQPILRWIAYIFTAVAIYGLWFRRVGGAN